MTGPCARPSRPTSPASSTTTSGTPRDWSTLDHDACVNTHLPALHHFVNVNLGCTDDYHVCSCRPGTDTTLGLRISCSGIGMGRSGHRRGGACDGLQDQQGGESG